MAIGHMTFILKRPLGFMVMNHLAIILKIPSCYNGYLDIILKEPLNLLY